MTKFLIFVSLILTLRALFLDIKDTVFTINVHDTYYVIRHIDLILSTIGLLLSFILIQYFFKGRQG